MATLRSFLKQSPVPVLLVCEYEDGEDKKVKLGEARSKFRDAELACKNAIHIEALDADGNTLRVWEAEDKEEREAEQVINTQPASPSMNDNMNMIVAMSRLLSEAADRSAERHAEAYALAYNQQALLVQTVCARLQGLEQAYQDQLMNRAEELDEQAERAPAAEQADPNADMMKMLMPMVMGSMMNANNGGTGGGQS